MCNLCGSDQTEICIFIALLPFGTCMRITAPFRSHEGGPGGVGGVLVKSCESCFWVECVSAHARTTELNEVGLNPGRTVYVCVCGGRSKQRPLVGRLWL